ncbi:MAG: hypothetical protein V4555_05515 [Acidobacteriota bacterium]
MHRYRLLPPLFDPPAKRPVPLQQQVVYMLFRGIVGVGFFVHGFLSAFAGAGLTDFATNFLTTFGSLPLHWMYGVVLWIGYAIPFVELLVGILLLLGFLTKAALMLGYCVLLTVLTQMLLLRAWALAEQLPIYFVAVTLLLLGRRRFDAPWVELLRKPE